MNVPIFLSVLFRSVHSFSILLSLHVTIIVTIKSLLTSKYIIPYLITDILDRMCGKQINTHFNEMERVVNDYL